MDRAVVYLRVSTRQQQRSGLGIEAQRATIARFAEAGNIRIIAEYVEAETGKGADALDRRPHHAAALAAAKAAALAFEKPQARGSAIPRTSKKSAKPVDVTDRRSRRPRPKPLTAPEHATMKKPDSSGSRSASV